MASQEAEMIRLQLMAAPRTWFSWGATKLIDMGKVVRIATDEQGSVSEFRGLGCLRFNVNGLRHKGLVYVIITPRDEYRLLFVKVQRGDGHGTILKDIDGIGVEQLHFAITYNIDGTGLTDNE